MLIPLYLEIIKYILLSEDFLKINNYLSSNNINSRPKNEILLKVTKTNDIKQYIDLLKNSCINILKCIYVIVSAYKEMKIIFNGKKLILGSLKETILQTITSLIYKNVPILQSNNGTPTIKNKKNRFDDTLEFKNNFFSLVLYIIFDLHDTDDTTLENFSVIFYYN